VLVLLLAELGDLAARRFGLVGGLAGARLISLGAGCCRGRGPQLEAENALAGVRARRSPQAASRDRTAATAPTHRRARHPCLHQRTVGLGLGQRVGNFLLHRYCVAMSTKRSIGTPDSNTSECGEGRGSGIDEIPQESGHWRFCRD
jgi:hypothetical protein